MINPEEFANHQMELLAEFSRYIADHPEVDALLPENSCLCFEVPGDEDFNRQSRAAAESSSRAEGAQVVCVKVKGVAPFQGSRLIDPVIEPVAMT